MIKSVMVAVDGSPSSLAALSEAVSWAERLQAELRGVFVEDEQRFSYYPVGASVEEEVPVPVPLPDEELAQVSKKWAGLGKELFTSADNYILQISDAVPPDSSLRQLIMAAVMCIDMVLKE